MARVVVSRHEVADKPVIDRYADVLARAFEDDPGAVWLLPDDGTRRQRLREKFRGTLRRGLRFGVVETAVHEPLGAAVWISIEEASSTRFPVSLRRSYFSLVLDLGISAFVRFAAMNSYLDRYHRRDAPGQHWYLAVVGVDPEGQSRGVGSELIRPMLSRADRERFVCYLETTRERNVPFYEKHGFAVVRHGNLPLGGPPFWTMLRHPQG